MTGPRIVFVTTCKGRVAHLRETLPRNMRDNGTYPNCKFIVLDYCDGPELESYLRTEWTAGNGYSTVYSFRDGDRFRVNHAKNLAARCGMLEGADILVTLDADNFTGPGFAQWIADEFRERPSPLSPNVPSIHKMPHGPGRPARGYAGRLAIRAQDFIKLGGYDEHDDFSTWRGEDTDMIIRLKNLGYQVGYIPNRFLHAIPHNAEVRFREYPEAIKYEDRREIQVLMSRTDTLVNYGQWGMGTVYKNFDFASPIELKALPTRVFGIGLHKTATTSLDAAFKILGFDSLHWGSGEAPKIWHEMISSGQSKTLERFYAACDLPIPLLYKQLDAAYPGSKFILTVRDEADWLKSVERMWSWEYNPHRWTWERWPITHRLHTELYGRRDFNAETMLATYRRHNREVIEYFGGRQDAHGKPDLLVMNMNPQHALAIRYNMDGAANWRALCGFLGQPVPDVPYPRLFKTERLCLPLSVIESIIREKLQNTQRSGHEETTEDSAG